MADSSTLIDIDLVQSQELETLEAIYGEVSLLAF